MSLLLLLCSTLFMHSHSLSLDQIHLALSENEVKEVFSARSHEEVPEYKLLRIRSRSRRHSDGTVSKQVSLSVFGEQHNLQLSRNSDLGAETFQIFYADAGPDGSTDFQRAEEAEMMDVGDPYQDAESGAALLIHHDPYTDALLLDGTIGPELVIRPAPESVRYHLDREAEQDLNSLKPDDELFLDQDENLQDERIAEDGFPMHHLMDLQGEHTRMQHHNNTIDNHRSRTRRRVHRPLAEGLHFVYKRATPPSMADYSLMEMDAMPKAPRRHRRSAPSVIYPEVLLIIDYDGFLLHDQDSNKIKKYFTSFMNGVDLRYRALRNPEIKVNIAGMIISRRADATPYLEKNMVTRDSIDSAAALTDMGKYLFEERRLPTYDIAMAITKFDMCRQDFDYGPCNRGTAGFAYVGGACVVNKRLTKVNSVAIVEDTGGFSGIIVAAHELGHLLGNVHDGSPPPSYLGGPGARRCRWEEGYIMSDLRHTEKGFKWSPCSLEEFDHFLNGETATCLYNAPHERHQLDRHLPGKLLSLDAQCKRDRGTSACFKDDRVCSQLFCFDQSTGYCVSYRPAAEGSACGHGKYCRDGYCVTDDSFGNGLGQFSYTSNDFFTSATHTRAVWTDPPSLEKSTTKSGWNKLVNEPHRSTRELAATTETSASSFGAAETSSVQPKRRKAPGRSKWQTPKAAVRTTLKPQSDVTSSPLLKEDRTRRPTSRRPTTTKQRITSRFPWRRRYTASTSTTTPTPRVSDNTIPQSTDDDDVCDDLVLRLVGNLNCKQFIERYGVRYCDRKYFQRNCCATRRRFCDSSVLSER